MKFRQMVWSQMKIRFEVILEDSMVPSRLISGTIVKSVIMHRVDSDYVSEKNRRLLLTTG